MVKFIKGHRVIVKCDTDTATFLMNGCDEILQCFVCHLYQMAGDGIQSIQIQMAASREQKPIMHCDC